MESLLFKSGFIGIIGRPNVGKSTLLNALIGEKLAIATYKPQTTRNRITGIKNLENGQLIFVDTPGIHRGTSPLNKYMVNVAVDTLGSVDLVMFLVEAGSEPNEDDLYTINLLKEARLPVILVINKIDLVRKDILLPMIDQFRKLHDFIEIIPISARTGDGIPILIESILKILPEGPQYFPEDQLTDSSERFLAAEIIREKIILLTEQEVPYSSAVIIDSFKEDEAKNLIRIQATITVEKDSQKGIIIGKRGAMLKEIGTRARLDMEKFFAARIYLELFVRVKKKWTQDVKQLKDLGYE
jgi:GTP-binding protein Era